MDWKICLMSSVFMIEMTVLMFLSWEGISFWAKFNIFNFLGNLLKSLDNLALGL